MSTLYVIVGRSLADYAANNEAAPVGFPIMQCFKCGRDITLSPSGLEKLKAHNGNPVCTECVINKMIDKPRSVEVLPVSEMSEYAQRELKTNPKARSNYDALVRLSKIPKPD